MKKSALISTLLLAVTALGVILFYLYGTDSPADKAVRDGVEAYNRTEYRTAYQHWLPAAQAGNAEAQANISALYLSGNGLAQNFTLAYVWIKLAEQNGARDTANILRIASARLSAQELQEADTTVRQCLETNYKDCR